MENKENEAIRPGDIVIVKANPELGEALVVGTAWNLLALEFAVENECHEGVEIFGIPVIPKGFGGYAAEKELQKMNGATAEKPEWDVHLHLSGEVVTVDIARKNRREEVRRIAEIPAEGDAAINIPGTLIDAAIRIMHIWDDGEGDEGNEN